MIFDYRAHMDEALLAKIELTTASAGIAGKRVTQCVPRLLQSLPSGPEQLRIVDIRVDGLPRTLNQNLRPGVRTGFRKKGKSDSGKDPSHKIGVNQAAMDSCGDPSSLA
jgi:hypothetical protein